MSEFKYVCIPVRTEEEGIETAEDVIGAMMWNNDEHKRPQAWPYDNDNPIIVMDSPLWLEKQLAEARAEIERLKCCTNCRSRLWAATGEGNCKNCKDFSAWTPQNKAALSAERGEGL